MLTILHAVHGRRRRRAGAVASAFAACLLARAAAADPPPPVAGDAPPVATITDARIKEGQAGTAALVFTVRLSGPPNALATVHYTTVDGTAAVADEDYLAVQGDLVFQAADTVRTISVMVRGDERLEGNEWLTVRLSNATGMVLADTEAIGFVANDERAGFVPAPNPPSIYTWGTVPSAWGDFDGDGLSDLPLYRSIGNGGLAEIPGFRALLAQGNYHGVAWCDYDRDGDLDVTLLGYAGVDMATPTPSLLLRNDGPAGFVNVAPANGMDVVGSSETAVWADFDGDGWPDLFAPYYSHIAPYQSFLYRNNRDGTFTERAQAAGVDLPMIPSQFRPEGAQAVDWNDDGYLDIYCASHLLQNDGSGVFTDVRADVGLPLVFDEGSASIDYDSDGDFDLYLRAQTGPRLFRNDAGQFSDRTAEAGLEAMGFHWGDCWADPDGDGDMDLLIIPATGSARLYLNQGDATFERDTLFDLLGVPGEMAAWGDCDGDGDADLVVGTGYTRQIWRNTLSQMKGYQRAILTVRVLDESGYQTMHGATVRLRQIGGPPGMTQTHIVAGGCSYLGQNDYNVTFGGVGSGRYELEVVFPSPAGSRNAVDGRDHPELWGLEPGKGWRMSVHVFRSGDVVINSAPVAGVLQTDLRPIHVLGAPIPTPTRGPVSIPLQLGASGSVALDIHDLSGRRLRRIDSGSLSAGHHAVRWDLDDDQGVPSSPGVYFCRLLVDGAPVASRRLLVVH